MNDAIVTGLLNALADEGKVLRANPERRGSGWRLTPAEFQRRRDGLELRHGQLSI